MTRYNNKVEKQKPLSEKEMLVIELLADGKTYKEIEGETGLTSGQLQFMIRGLLYSFDCVNSVQLVATLFRKGFANLYVNEVSQ